MNRLFSISLALLFSLALSAQHVDCNKVKEITNGQCTTYYALNKMKEVRSYKDGVFDGEWRTYNEKGLLTAVASYKAGKKHGEWTIWDDKGVKRYQMFYKDGEKTGLWIRWDEGGKEISRKDYSAAP